MHEYRRFIQAELDARGWKPAELARRSRLHRQLIWKILNDERDHLGQMPDESTMEALAAGLGISVDRVRTAAARSLSGYTDDGAPITTDLKKVPIDALLGEIRRRIDGRAAADKSQPRKRIINRQAPRKKSGVGRNQNGNQRGQLRGG